jgi:hypothetical protein
MVVDAGSGGRCRFPPGGRDAFGTNWATGGTSRGSARLDRYERRARSRRNTATRAFDAARLAGV